MKLTRTFSTSTTRTACWILVATLLGTGCGRFGFQAHPISEDGGADASESLDMLADGASDAADFGMDGAERDAFADLGDDATLDSGPPADPGVLVTPTSGLITTEMGGMASFTVVLLAAPTENVTIGISSSDVSEGIADTSSLQFTPLNWDAPQMVSVSGVDDTIADGATAYTIVTAPATSVDLRYSGYDADDVSVSNTDDETPGVTVSPISGLITSEDGLSDTFTVVLNAAPTSDVSISFSSSDELEVWVAPLSLVFTPINWSAPQTVTVTGVDDDAVDGDKTFKIRTLPTTSADAAYVGIDADDVDGINRDDESAGIIVTPTSGLETSEAGGTAMFTIVLQSQPVADVLIALSSSEEGEGSVSPTSVVFTALDWDIPHAVTVIGVDDVIADGDQVFTVNVSPATSLDPFYSGRTSSDVSLTNRDDDTPGYTVTPVSGLFTSESGASATFSIVLNARPSATVIFAVTSSDATEVAVATPNPRSTPALWYEPQIVTLTGVNDPAADGNQPVDITVHVSVSADPNFMALADTHVSATNLDDETAGITVTPTSGFMTSEAGSAATFTVVLNSQPSAMVTIPLSSDTPSEGTVSPASVTFTTSNWSSPRTVTVNGVNDQVADGARVYNIVTGAAVSADGAYSGMAASDVMVTNADNDVAGIVVAPTSIVAPENGTPATFLVSLRSQPTASVTIPIHMLDLAQGSLAPLSLTFTTGNWSVGQVVTCTGINDGVMDGAFVNTAFTDPAISTDMTYSGMDGPNVLVAHNETAGIGVSPTSGLVTTEAGGTASFTVVLLAAPSANVSILVNNNPAEGTPHPSLSGSVVLAFTPLNWATPQTVTVRGLNDGYDDGDVLYNIVLSPAASSDTQYNGLDAPDVSLTNIDDDTAGLSVTVLDGATTTENAGTASFRLTYTTMSTAPLRMTFAVSDPTEGAFVTAPNSSATTFDLTPSPVGSFTFSIRGVDDLVVDGDVPYSVNITFTTTDPGYASVTIPPVAITNIDNDSGDIIVSPTAPAPVTEQGAISYASIVLARAPSANVVVGLSSGDTGEATVSPTSVTFTTANWNTPRSIVITGVMDGIIDGNQTATIITAPAVSTDGSYSGLNAADLSVLVVDVDDGRCVSVTPTYRPAIGYMSGGGSVSTDGRFVTFHTAANVTAGDTNAAFDSFLRDRVNGTTIRVSESTAGAQASGSTARVSADGRFVLFSSDATNLVAGDTNSTTDVFLRDTMFGTTERVSLSNSGTELSMLSSEIGISTDGRYAFFVTPAAAVVGDTNNNYDVYVRDRMLSTTTRVSVATGGAQGSAATSNAAASADGRYVAFLTANALVAADSGNSIDAYLRDLMLGTTALVSVSTTGTAAGTVQGVSISANGRYVLFESSASTIIPGDAAATTDSFVRDMMTSTVVRASVATDGTPHNGYVSASRLSDDGQRVAFTSTATNLAPDDTNGCVDAFVRDLTANTTTLVSRSPGGSVQSCLGFGVAFLGFSGDGHTVVFATDSRSILDPSYDTNTGFDVYAVTIP
ncbi:MAG: hypothetical protein IPK60_19685 [Sandaracinaceae bacterium]|nr:hypothetical protein [Sandaracinaceae bacterium]